jgi:hypothetical protein
MAERSAATPQTVQPVMGGAALRGLTPPPMKREFARSRRWRRQGAVWIASPLELRRTAIHEHGRDVRCLRDWYSPAFFFYFSVLRFQFLSSSSDRGLISCGVVGGAVGTRSAKIVPRFLRHQ